MDRLDVRIGRCSLALSLAVKAGIAAWLLLAVAGNPIGSAALTVPGAQKITAQSDWTTARVERGRKRRSARHRRAEPAGDEKQADQDQPAATAEPAEEGVPPLPEPHPGRAKSRNDAKAAAADKDEREDEAKSADHPPAEAEPEPEPVWSEAEIIEALEECVRLLAPIAANLEVSKPIRSGQCGSPAPVVLKRIGTATPVEISPPAVINCRMVAKLHEWVETTLQPISREMLDAPVTRMVNASGYVCRNRYGSASGKISEHAFANALDISAFALADGRTVDVLTNWGKTERDLRAIAQAKAKAEQEAKAAAAKAKDDAKKKEGESGKDAQANTAGADAARTPPEEEAEGEPPLRAEGRKVGREPAKGKRRGGKQTAAAEGRNLGGNVRSVSDAEGGEDAKVTTNGAYLRRLHEGACEIFGTVLGPEANEAHRNHFHLDLAPRKRRAFCE